ncbi:hypothetical protein [Nocardia uniformis]|uniref:hypothetical protein n=1 Tax=Nocardia uniformis TaxID=53432 RepID=UPI000B0EC84C|nr:hypothetical protein [Nocardia uniformis]
MRPRPTAVGYICREVSGIRLEWDEFRIRSLAARFGYDYAKTIVLGSGTSDRIARLIDSVRRTDAEAVFVPSETHFLGSRAPAELIRIADVNTVDTANTYARWIDTEEANAATCGNAVHLQDRTEQWREVQSG